MDANTQRSVTGLVPAVIVASALLAFPLSIFLLRLYRRAVLRLMNARGAGAQAPLEARPATVPARPARVRTEVAGAPSPAAALEPWEAIAVYAVAAAAFAAVMAGGRIGSMHDPNVPLIRFLILFWTHLWPLPLTIAIVCAVSTRTTVQIAAAYVAVMIAVMAVALARNPGQGLFELPLFWLLEDGPVSLLLLAFLARPVRAIGPMVLAYLVLVLLGSQSILAVATASPSVSKAIAQMGFSWGLGAYGVFFGMMAAGFLVCAVLGCGLLVWLGRRYRQKKLSDESLTVDSIWLVCGVVQSIPFAFDGLIWAFTGLVAFAAYKLVARAGFRRLARPRANAAPALLVLRVFSLGNRSERLFRGIGKLWLRRGRMALIAGPDLLTATIEPHELLEFIVGRLRRQFVESEADLQRRLAELDLRPDPDGRHRISEFFCHADTWQLTMQGLAGRCDSVLMDLRSFSTANHGCLYELGWLLEAVPLRKVVFVVDGSTDRAFLRATLDQLAVGLSESSPNRRGSPTARLFPLQSTSRQEVSALLQLLGAPSPEPVAQPSW